MNVNVVVNGLGCYMTIPDLCLATVYIGQKIGEEIALAEKHGDSSIEINIRVEIDK